MGPPPSPRAYGPRRCYACTTGARSTPGCAAAGWRVPSCQRSAARARAQASLARRSAVTRPQWTRWTAAIGPAGRHSAMRLAGDGVNNNVTVVTGRGRCCHANCVCVSEDHGSYLMAVATWHMRCRQASGCSWTWASFVMCLVSCCAGHANEKPMHPRCTRRAGGRAKTQARPWLVPQTQSFLIVTVPGFLKQNIPP